MAKKPILTDDELDDDLHGGLSPRDAVPPPLPGSASGAPSGAPAGAVSGAPAGATRPLDTPAPTPPEPRTSTTRMIADPETPPPPQPTQGRDASGHVRPKTRIHGYGGEAMPAPPEADTTPETARVPVVGWLVVTAGPGRGASVPLHQGMSGIGRDPVNSAQVDFGDDTISREAHAYVTYDDEGRIFYLSHGGKTNLVRLNGTPVLTVEMLAHGDTIRIGATSLMFVALCGPDFDWSDA